MLHRASVRLERPKKRAQNSEQWRALLNMVMNIRGPQKLGHFLTSWATVSFSRRALLHGVT